MKKDTLLTHSGRDPARYQGMVNTPVFRTSTVIFPDLATYEARGGDDYKKVRYGLSGTPTTFALEEAVAKMEGGHARGGAALRARRHHRRAVRVSSRPATTCW